MLSNLYKVKIWEHRTNKQSSEIYVAAMNEKEATQKADKNILDSGAKGLYYVDGKAIAIDTVVL